MLCALGFAANFFPEILVTKLTLHGFELPDSTIQIRLSSDQPSIRVRIWISTQNIFANCPGAPTSGSQEISSVSKNSISGFPISFFLYQL